MNTTSGAVASASSPACRGPTGPASSKSVSARILPSLIVHINRKAIVRVLADPMMVFPALPDRIDVDRDPTEMGHVMEQLVAHLSGDLMTLADRQIPRHRDAQ
jgi:hypothetical protein